MLDFLKNHDGVCEIIFSLALAGALLYALYLGQENAQMAILGGILGYMKGRADSKPVAVPSATVVSIALLCLLLSGCAYNSTTITAQGNVTCNSSVDKPTTINPFTGNSLPVNANATGNTVPVGAVP